VLLYVAVVSCYLSVDVEYCFSSFSNEMQFPDMGYDQEESL